MPAEVEAQHVVVVVGAAVAPRSPHRTVRADLIEEPTGGVPLLDRLRVGVGPPVAAAGGRVARGRGSFRLLEIRVDLVLLQGVEEGLNLHFVEAGEIFLTCDHCFGDDVRLFLGEEGGRFFFLVDRSRGGLFVFPGRTVTCTTKAKDGQEHAREKPHFLLLLKCFAEFCVWRSLADIS